MLNRTKGFILLLLLVVTGLASQVYNDTVSTKERRILTNHLKDSRTALVTSTKNLSETQFTFKPSPESWSVKECVEHLMVSEQSFWKLAQETLKQPAQPGLKDSLFFTDSTIMKLVPDRSQKNTAPESLQPQKGQAQTGKQALEAFKKERAQTIKFVKTTTEDIRSHITRLQFGHADVYQILLLQSAHTERHLKQIEEIKKHPGFPN